MEEEEAREAGFGQQEDDGEEREDAGDLQTKAATELEVGGHLHRAMALEQEDLGELQGDVDLQGTDWARSREGAGVRELQRRLHRGLRQPRPELERRIAKREGGQPHPQAVVKFEHLIRKWEGGELRGLQKEGMQVSGIPRWKAGSGSGGRRWWRKGKEMVR